MKKLATALKIFLLLTIITGFIYPLLIWGFGQLVFPEKANGSLIVQNDKVIGSRLIGQQFDSLQYFSSRPSAISYNSATSGASNYGLLSATLESDVKNHKKEFIQRNNLSLETQIPSEMVFTSASGLDPHISPEAAFLQVNRIIKIRNFNDLEKNSLIHLIDSLSEKPQFLCLGSSRINVLLLNIELDKIK